MVPPDPKLANCKLNVQLDGHTSMQKKKSQVGPNVKSGKMSPTKSFASYTSERVPHVSGCVILAFNVVIYALNRTLSAVNILVDISKRRSDTAEKTPKMESKQCNAPCTGLGVIFLSAVFAG